MASIGITSGFSTSTVRVSSPTVARKLALVVVFALLYILATRVYPDGGHDARSTWTLKARFIAGQSFAYAYTELPMSDYPPLLPLVSAAGYRVFGFDAPVPQVLHGLLFATLVWLTSRRLWIGLLVGGVGLHYAPQLYADLPLALLLVLAFMAHERGRYGWTGLLLGLATLTKNEGALMLAAYLAVSTLWNRRIPFEALRGAFVPVLLLVAFKLYVNAPTELVASGGVLERLTDGSRYRVILEIIPTMTTRFGVGVLLLLPVLLWAKGIRIRVSMPLLTLGLVWLGYMGIYLITPYDLAWHIGSSYDRLLMQLFPALLLTVAAETHNPAVPAGSSGQVA